MRFVVCLYVLAEWDELVLSHVHVHACACSSPHMAAASSWVGLVASGRHRHRPALSRSATNRHTRHPPPCRLQAACRCATYHLPAASSRYCYRATPTQALHHIAPC